MIEFNTIIKKFNKQGEKTGWTYIEIHPGIIEKIKGPYKRSFRVKGKLDSYNINNVALIPIGNGYFIMPLNATIRKGIKKKHGAYVKVTMEEDKSGFILNKDFADCLKEDDEANTYFMQLPYGHKNYFNNWINAAKTAPTIEKRIAMVLRALSQKMDFGQMLRSQKQFMDVKNDNTLYR